jgi:hypothetical protein
MYGFAEDIATAIQDPDIEIDADNGQYEGVVKTAYFTSKLPKDGELTWKR